MNGIRPGATHRLVGVDHALGMCQHCGRALSHLFVIEDADGGRMVVGRTHAKQYTGWTPTVAQAEGAERQAIKDAAVAAWLAEAPELPALFEAARTVNAGDTVATLRDVERGLISGRMTYADATTFATDMCHMTLMGR